MDWLSERLIAWIPLVLSLSVHEWAHARAAWALGDDTAKVLGRMSLDPLVHADPIGTFVLPILGVPFGWAKPVPVNPMRFRPGLDGRVGMMLVAGAGPLSNLGLAALCGAAVPFVPPSIRAVATSAAVLNVALAVFNLLPIPPLDGSRVVEGLVPLGLRPAWDRLAGAGPWIVLIGAVVLGSLFWG